MSSLNDLMDSCRELLKAADKSEDKFESLVFKNILNATIDTMDGKIFQDGFKQVQKELGDEFAEKFISMLSFGIIHAAYSAVASYHNEMMELYKGMSLRISGVEGSLHGLEGGISVLRKKVDEIQKKEIINSVEK